MGVGLKLSWTLFVKNPAWCKEVKLLASSLKICKVHKKFNRNTCYSCKVSRDTCQAIWESENTRKVERAIKKSGRDIRGVTIDDELDHDPSAEGVT